MMFLTLNIMLLNCFCIGQSIGDKCAPVKRMVSGSVSWAKLEPDGERKVTEFIDSLDEREGEQARV